MPKLHSDTACRTCGPTLMRAAALAAGSIPVGMGIWQPLSCVGNWIWTRCWSVSGTPTTASSISEVPFEGRHARGLLNLDTRTVAEFIASLDVSRTIHQDAHIVLLPSRYPGLILSRSKGPLRMAPGVVCRVMPTGFLTVEGGLGSVVQFVSQTSISVFIALVVGVPDGLILFPALLKQLPLLNHFHWTKLTPRTHVPELLHRACPARRKCRQTQNIDKICLKIFVSPMPRRSSSLIRNLLNTLSSSQLSSPPKRRKLSPNRITLLTMRGPPVVSAVNMVLTFILTQKRVVNKISPTRPGVELDSSRYGKLGLRRLPP